MIDNLHATGSILTSSVVGLPGFPVEDVTLANIHIESEESGPADWASRPIPEKSESYPEAHMFGRLPSYGFYLRHVAGVRLRNIDIIATPDEARPALVSDDVENLDLDSLRSTSIAGDQPTIKLIQTRQAFLRTALRRRTPRHFYLWKGTNRSGSC